MLQPAPKKKYVPIAKEKKNLEDASSNKNMRPPFTPIERKNMPKVGSTGTAKNGKSFPDLNKDGKITKADILKGRGVIAKKGMSVKKAQNGAKTADSTNYYTRKMLSDMDMSFRSSGDLKKTYDSKFNKDVKDLNRQKLKGKTGYDKNGYPLKKKAKTGASVKKCKYGCK